MTLLAHRRNPARPGSSTVLSFAIVLSATLTLYSARAQGQVFAQRAVALGAAADGEESDAADWSIDEMLALARDQLDENWRNRLKYYRMVAATRFDEIRGTCQLTDEQLRRLQVAAEGQAFKLALQERAQTERNVENVVRQYHQRGTNKGQVRSMIASYTNQRIYYSYRNNAASSQFFDRIVSATLDTKQQAEYEARKKARADRLQRLFLERLVAQLDLYLRLTPEQEKKIREMFRPMLGAGRIQIGPNSFMSVDTFNMMDMNVWSMMRGAQAKKMQGILTNAQWELWKSIMQERVGGWGMGGVVEEVVEDDEEEAAGDEAATDDDGDQKKDDKETDKDDEKKDSDKSAQEGNEKQAAESGAAADQKQEQTDDAATEDGGESARP